MAVDRKTYKDIKSFFKDFEQSADAFYLEGFLEPEEKKGGAKFAPNGDCQNWISLPAEAIKEIEILREKEWCYTENDHWHTHPFVRILIDLSNPIAAKAVAQLSALLLSRRRGSQVINPQIWPQPPQQSSGPGLFFLGSPPVGRYRAQPKHGPGLFPLGQSPDFRFDCKPGEQCLYYEGCSPYKCACLREDGLAYCSGCCVG